MKNTKLVLEFDGTAFYGWQKQPEVRTVQGVLEETAAVLFRQDISVNGCCRTDAGVHAFGFTGNFLVDTTMEAAQIRSALGVQLPEDIVVKQVGFVHKLFHARYDCIARRYVYRITTSPTAVFRRFLSYTKYPLDVSTMERAAGLLVGEKDFTSFAPSALNVDIPTVCDVLEAGFRVEDSVISFDIKANRFLHHMVRNIVGTLIEVGRGRMEPEQMEEILCKKDRRAAGPTAPACGLALEEVYYPEQE
jgi:tRNA pseudouridine38-40 synthase